MIEKKLEALFGFRNTETLDFGSIWSTLNHLLQQGKFWLCARILHFLHDFTTYSADKHKFDQRIKFLHQMRALRKLCLWDSNDHYTWHLVVGRLPLNLQAGCIIACMHAVWRNTKTKLRTCTLGFWPAKKVQLGFGLEALLPTSIHLRAR